MPNPQQLVVALTGGDIVLFEADPYSGICEVEKKELGHEITCLALDSLSERANRTRFLGMFAFITVIFGVSGGFGF